MEAIQQQSFPITEARVISAAAPPQQKSGPLTSVVLGIAVAIGFALSFLVAILREAVDLVFRTARQVEAKLHTRCLAVLPLLVGKSSKSKHSTVARPVSRGGSEGKIATIVSPSVTPPPPVGSRLGSQIRDAGAKNVSQLVQSDLTRNALKKDGVLPPGSAAVKRPIVPARPFMRQVIDEPLSAFAEAFRSIKVAADISGCRVIGITSSIPAEGKSTVSSNLAELMAHAGKRVILLDGDLRNPSLTRALAPSSKAGLIEVMDGQVALDDAVYIDQDTGLRFLPAIVKSGLAYTNEILASDRFKDFIDGLRNDYDYIIIDFSPIAPVVDVRGTTQVVDSYIYVIEWAKTQRNLVEHQLSSFPELYERLLGVVLNKADVRVLERYDTYYGKYYHKNYYGGQYGAKAS
jgi:capsular exopolysaccharide synthesis family protein